MVTKSEQAKVVIVEHEGPCSLKKLKNLHKISFLSDPDSQEENTNGQLPPKESNPGHFTLPCTIGNFNFYAMADLGDSVEDSVWSKRYSEWCNENSHGKKPRPKDYTFKEWVKFKKGHLDISKSVGKDLFRLWVIDRFIEALDPDKNPLKGCFDEYKWVFHTEIEQLAYEYEIKMTEKGKVPEEIWAKYERARYDNKNWCLTTDVASYVLVTKTMKPCPWEGKMDQGLENDNGGNERSPQEWRRGF
ncbi:hypothetical protein Tco_1348442 [Tanacetum coccineum]